MCEDRKDTRTASDTASIDRDDRIRDLRGASSGDGLATKDLTAERRRERGREERRAAGRGADRP